MKLSEIENLEQRVTNLEVALHGLWVLLKDLQPMATQKNIDNMLDDHLNTSSLLGGFKRGHFDL